MLIFLLLLIIIKISMTIKRALISVFNKDNIIPLAKDLVKIGVEILSTGGSAQLLREQHIEVVEVSNYTSYPEIMAGRIKTLHPKIHGGILARRGKDEKIMATHKILPIDLVVVNLYPFEETISHTNCQLADAIENIDIGGSAMIRAAAKNCAFVSVLVSSKDYSWVIDEIKNLGNTRLKTRHNLACKAFEYTTRYDGLVASYLGGYENGFAQTLNLQLHKKSMLRYGENAHQNAALYVEGFKQVKNLQQKNIATTNGIAHGEQVQGKTLSYNNIIDSDSAFMCVRQFKIPACVIVKHTNPCGVALGISAYKAYLSAYKADTTSAFGSIIAFNSTLDAKTAQIIINRQFVEVIIASMLTERAKTVLAKKPNIRVIICPGVNRKNVAEKTTGELDYKCISGGLLVQDKDDKIINKKELKCVSKIKPTDAQTRDLLFAFQVVKFVKSNAIVCAKNQMTIGIGAGQTSRVYAVKIALMKAKDEKLALAGSVMASDAFFPFRDAIDIAAKAGIKAIISPNGSLRDDEIITAANEHNMAVMFSSVRHFRH